MNAVCWQRMLCLRTSVVRACVSVVAIALLALIATPLAAQDIHTAALENNTDAVRAALEDGANPNGYNLTGFAPLHSAARSGNVAMARVLVENGANITLRSQTSGSDTPLHFAALNNHASMVAFLLENGADPNTKNSFGNTPFDSAGVTVDRQTARLLAAAGASAGLLGRLGYDSGGDPLSGGFIFGALAFSTFFDIPLASGPQHYAPFTSEFILRDLFVTANGQLLFAVSPLFALGAEAGVALSASTVLDNYAHVEIPVRLVASFIATRQLTLQVVAGAHLMFPDLVTGPDAAVRFEGGARGVFGSGIGKLFVDVSYVLPFAVAFSALSAEQLNSVAQSANSIRVGVGWRIEL